MLSLPLTTFENSLIVSVPICFHPQSSVRHGSSPHSAHYLMADTIDYTLCTAEQ